MNKKFTLIIPLYNHNYINIQIKSIYSLLLNNIDLEVIFVDDWSNEKYRKIYDKFLSKILVKNIIFRYRYLWDKNNKNRVCLARNVWVKLSKSDNLVFIDQDTILHKNYFNDLISLINKKDIIIWPYYWYNNLKKSLKDNDIEYYIQNWYINKNNFEDFRIDFYKEKQENWRIWEFFAASNFFIKKEVYLKIWWFDESITTWWDEDVEFWYRLYKNWFNIKFYENLKVLNISDKLYIEPFLMLENSKIKDLTKNFLLNYNKHWKSYEYKRYIIDRFNHINYDYKLNTSEDFQKEILFHEFYKTKSKNIIFFRLDDVKELSEDFKKIIKIFINYKIPLVLAVEPWNIDKQIVAYINIIKNKYPDLIDIVQHGYKHIKYQQDWYKYEFWELRDYNNQLSDIRNWLRIMEKNFWDNFLKAFVPPYNNINLDTEEILGDLEFNIFSSGYPYGNYFWNKNIISIPFFVDIINNYDTLSFKSENYLYNELNNYLFRDWFAWIMLHPQFFNDNTFILLVKILKYLKNIDINFYSFSLFHKNYWLNGKK